MVRITPDDSLPRGVSCRMTATTSGGRTLVSQIDHPLGSIERPMPRDRAERKLHMLADPVVGEATVGRLSGLVNSIEDLPGLGPVLTACRPSA
jgi:hypothetical protein